MTEHVHEWRWHSEHGEDGIDCRLCDEEYGYRPENWMDRDEIICRLNTTERLKNIDCARCRKNMLECKCD